MFETENGLVGKFFHSYDDGTKRMKWQGKIIGRINDYLYLVQLFEWAAGQPSKKILVKAQTMIENEWEFFDNSEEMIERYEKIGASRPADDSWMDSILSTPDDD